MRLVTLLSSLVLALGMASTAYAGDALCDVVTEEQPEAVVVAMTSDLVADLAAQEEPAAVLACDKCPADVAAEEQPAVLLACDKCDVAEDEPEAALA